MSAQPPSPPCLSVVSATSVAPPCTRSPWCPLHQRSTRAVAGTCASLAPQSVCSYLPAAAPSYTVALRTAAGLQHTRSWCAAAVARCKLRRLLRRRSHISRYIASPTYRYNARPTYCPCAAPVTQLQRRHAEPTHEAVYSCAGARARVARGGVARTPRVALNPTRSNVDSIVSRIASHHIMVSVARAHVFVLASYILRYTPHLVVPYITSQGALGVFHQARAGIASGAGWCTASATKVRGSTCGGY